RIDGLVTCQATREVDLVAVTGADVLEDRRHALLERDAIEARVPARQRGRGGRACTVARRLDCLHQQVACLAVPVQLAPSRSGIHLKPSREAGQDEVGDRRGPAPTVTPATWARRHPLD